jgi:hypothetical protein
VRVADLVSEAQGILDLIGADLLASVGVILEARVRLVSPEEQQAQDLDFDATLNDPGTKVVLLGSAVPGPQARPLDEYESYWALETPNSLSMIHDAIDVLDVVQEEAIKDLWREGRSASWPECPEHGGHPLNSVIDDGNLMWRCPKDHTIAIPLGGLGQYRRFPSA